MSRKIHMPDSSALAPRSKPVNAYIQSGIGWGEQSFTKLPRVILQEIANFKIKSYCEHRNIPLNTSEQSYQLLK